MNAGNEKLVEVYRACGEATAQFIKGKLESSGIAAVLQSRAAPSVHAFTLDGMGEYRVMVLESDAEEARNLIEEDKDV
jgi:hypothetical protein